MEGEGGPAHEILSIQAASVGGGHDTTKFQEDPYFGMTN